MYDGDDRVRQVAQLREIASEIRDADWEGTPQEKVEFFLHELQEEMPSWFDGHDLHLLEDFVAGFRL